MSPITTQVASLATTQKLCDANAQRKVLIIENTDTNRLHVLLNSGSATTTAYSFSLAQNANMKIERYTGEVNGIWAADGSGSAIITQY